MNNLRRSDLERELAARLMEEEGLAGEIAPRIHPADRSKPLPLSFAQERLWFLAQLDPGSVGYNAGSAHHLLGPLEVTIVERCLTEIIRRHETLRTTFSDKDGQPRQVISPPHPFVLPYINLGLVEEGDREAELQDQIQAFKRVPFDLTSDPVFRAVLFRMHDEDHVLVFSIHHIATDGWSSDVLWREFAALYAAFSQGRPSPLPELRIQYADYALWQREWLRGAELERQISYWRRQLSKLTTLDLPADRPRPPMQAFEGGSTSITVDAETWQRLKRLAGEQQATQYIVLLAAFFALLYRYTGQDDLVVGTPIANRVHSVSEHLIGFFANTLALRVQVEGFPTFRTLLKQVQEMAFDAYAHQDLPFEKLVEELNPARDQSRNPLFQVLFVLQGTAKSRAELPGLAVTPMRGKSQSTRFDMEWHLRNRGQIGVASVIYSTALFDAETVGRLTNHFATLLQEIARDPDRPISAYEILSPAEKRQLTHTFARAQATPSHIPGAVHHLFEMRTQQTPAAVAATHRGRNLSYQELNARANQVAHHLLALGVRQDSVVGVCTDRSFDMLVAALGILKAGAAYMPLDPAYPTERLAFMVRDAQADVVLAQTQFKGKLEATRATIVCMDADAAALGEMPASNPAVDVEHDNLAYVLYTSGSTGIPKAVSMPHGPLTNLISWHCHDQGLSCNGRTLQFSSFSFDVWFQECFSTWYSGGTLVLISDDVQRDPHQLLRFLADARIEALFAPFVALQQLCEVFEEMLIVPDALRKIVTAGEQLRITPQVRRFLSALPGCQLHNHYGPTECHVVTAHTLSGPVGDWPDIAPIGRPIANTQVYLLDRHFNPVPIGVSGEICIGGDALARGYLGRPEQTAEAFVPNPFDNGSGSRLYRTGDLARWLPDGSIRFLGRSDLQIKIRGFRVEPGEVEATLGRHPDVQDCCVVALGGSDGGATLAAYVIPKPHSHLTSSQLGRFLKTTLPDHLIPGTIVFMETFPRTVTGKTDRRALPVPDRLRPELDQAFVAPRTDLETKLVGIWRDVLNVERIGIHDDFFDLGGHSLLATQIVSRIAKSLQIQLPLRSLFAAPTIASLATLIEMSFLAEPESAGPDVDIDVEITL